MKMKTVILTCTFRGADNRPQKQRFVVEVDELTGDAQIRDERSPLIDRDRRVRLQLSGQMVELAVETA